MSNLAKLQILQRRYIIKFGTDGAVLNKTRHAVQGSFKLIPCNSQGKPAPVEGYPKYLEKEIILYYYIGQ